MLHSNNTKWTSQGRLIVFTPHSLEQCTISTPRGFQVEINVWCVEEESNHWIVTFLHCPHQPCLASLILCVDTDASLQGSFHTFQVTFLAQVPRDPSGDACSYTHPIVIVVGVSRGIETVRKVWLWFLGRSLYTPNCNSCRRLPRYKIILFLPLWISREMHVPIHTQL